jgi:hypothetical protein
MISGDNDTDDKFYAGINDTGEQLSPVTTALAKNLLPESTNTGEQGSPAVTMQPVINFLAGINDTGEQLSPVTTTPAITFFPGVVDTGHK